jgi:hypothetical protein
MDQLETGFGHWLAGFMDGEGYFSLRAPARCGTPYVQVKASVQIVQRRDNRAVLTAIHQCLGCGVVYDFKGSGRSKPISAFRVHRAADLAETIVPFFRHYPLRSKKQLVFELWAQGVALIYAKAGQERHGGGRYGGPKWTAAALQEIQELIAAIDEVRAMPREVGHLR